MSISAYTAFKVDTTWDGSSATIELNVLNSPFYVTSYVSQPQLFGGRLEIPSGMSGLATNNGGYTVTSGTIDARGKVVFTLSATPTAGLTLTITGNFLF